MAILAGKVTRRVAKKMTATETIRKTIAKFKHINVKTY